MRRPCGTGCQNAGSDINLCYGPPVADAWRFDNAGCQTTAYVHLTNEANSKGCPVTLGTQPLTITTFAYDSISMRMNIRLAYLYNLFVPAPGVTYTLWNVFFDHTHSLGGAIEYGLPVRLGDNAG